MKKIIQFGNKAIILFDNGSYYEVTDLSTEDISTIIESENDEDVLAIIDKDYLETKKEIDKVNDLVKLIQESNILTFKGECIYWEEVSPLSLPSSLAEAIVKAEQESNDILLETYKNFWTLMSLNPDERCRKNLFWFLNKNGLVISRSGFFVAYRNADFKEIDEEGKEVYTDCHTRTTTIKIGEVVSIPREECDDNQDITCSTGLHLGSKHWLKKDYFGSQGLVCLCNPADVVAVPPRDDYGKLRTCAYLPIEKADFDSEGSVIPYEVSDGFTCNYVTKAIYEGLMGTEEDSDYKIIIPELPGINKESISKSLLDIAYQCITKKEL